MIWNIATDHGHIVVREQIEPDDEPGLLRLFDQSADYFHVATGLPSAPGDVQSLFYALPDGADLDDKRLFTIRSGEEIIGVIDAVMRHPQPNACSIGLFLISTSHRRQSVGTSVARVLLSELRDAGVKQVVTSVKDGWEPGRKFIESLGFAVDAAEPASSDDNRRRSSTEAPAQRAVLSL